MVNGTFFEIYQISPVKWGNNWDAITSWDISFLSDETQFFVENAFSSTMNEYLTLECDNALIDIDVDSDILESSIIKNIGMFEIK